MKKILIIEDDSFLQGLASRKLKAEGFEVSGAADHKAAFASMETSKPDLILLDLLLPEVDGFGILAKIRENPAIKDMPVIIFSNCGEDKDITRAKELGVDEFMVKSNFTLDELVEKVKAKLA